MKALIFSRFGGPEVMEYRDIPDLNLNADEILIEMKAIGLNYADIYRRKGNYHLEGNPPFIAGYEGAGVVVKTTSPLYKVGDKVSFADVPFSNAEYVAASVEHVIPLPDDISFNMAASVLLQGLTAQYLAADSYQVKLGDVVLVHAAAGGVGQILSQICKLHGATVIGLTRDKRKIADILHAKADHALILGEGWQERVMEITEGKGVDVAFDSVGSTLMDSFSVTKVRGTVVFYGMSAADPKPVDPRMLMEKSKTLTGGDLWSHLPSKEERLKRSKELFDWIIQGKVKLKTPKEFSLSDGRAAHSFLEEGKSAGKVLLIPDKK
ncbi:alcohol dehydrogenase [Alphaproteobacteria bacterium 46_93_T64]|nr:alcohol dehydrogenase [Alphaproteobacteria bacterium 46_93_T64]